VSGSRGWGGELRKERALALRGSSEAGEKPGPSSRRTAPARS
jgi:hypothetical protein